MEFWSTLPYNLNFWEILEEECFWKRGLLENIFGMKFGGFGKKELFWIWQVGSPSALLGMRMKVGITLAVLPCCHGNSLLLNEIACCQNPIFLKLLSD